MADSPQAREQARPDSTPLTDTKLAEIARKLDRNRSAVTVKEVRSLLAEVVRLREREHELVHALNEIDTGLKLGVSKGVLYSVLDHALAVSLDEPKDTTR